MKINGVEVSKDGVTDVKINGVLGTAAYVMPDIGMVKVVLVNGDVIMLMNSEDDFNG
jgi:hypothetical protein